MTEIFVSKLFAQIYKPLQLFVMAISLSTVAGNAYSDSDKALPKDFSKPYTERQTYKEGQQSFYKDNNVWVYTPAFAKTFGMPPEKHTRPSLRHCLPV